MSPRRNVAAMAGVPYSKGSGLYNALGQPDILPPLIHVPAPFVFWPKQPRERWGCYGADARAGNRWGKRKKELPGRRFFVRTRFLLAVSPATGRV
jgi:hypothetical protein